MLGQSMVCRAQFQQALRVACPWIQCCVWDFGTFGTGLGSAQLAWGLGQAHSRLALESLQTCRKPLSFKETSQREREREKEREREGDCLQRCNSFLQTSRLARQICSGWSKTCVAWAKRKRPGSIRSIPGNQLFLKKPKRTWVPSQSELQLFEIHLCTVQVW